MSKKIKEKYRSAGLKPPKGRGIHTTKFHDCVIAVTKSGGAKNPHAVCMSRLGKTKAVKKAHRRSAKS